MKTKVLYNEQGRVLMVWQDTNIDLSGNLFIEVEIPEHKQIAYIDLTGDEPLPVFKDTPKTHQDEIEELKAQVDLLALMVDIELPSEEGEI